MRNKFYIPILIIVSFLMYSNTLKNSFIWDDKGIIESLSLPEYQKHLSNPFFFLTPSYWKDYTKFHDVDAYIPVSPMRMLSFNIDYKMWRYNPFGYHLTNLMLHIINVLLLYFFLATLLKDGNVAFVSSIFFAVHPIHSESINWIKNRVDLIATVFILLSLISFIKTTLNEKRKALFYIFSLIFFFFALISKEISITLLAIIPIYIVFFIQKDKWKKNLLFYMPFLLMGLFYFVLTQIILKKGLNIPHMDRLDLYTNILLIFKTISYYLKLLIWPFDFNSEREISLPNFLFEPYTLISVIIVLTLFWLAYFFYKKDKLTSFFIMWFLITISPVSNIIYLAPRPIAEQRLYLPSVAFCVLLARLIYNFPIRIKPTMANNRIKIFLVFFIGFIYFAFGFKRNFDWRDELIFWKTTVSASPQNARAWVNLGQAYFLKNEYEKAKEAFEKSLMLAPGFPAANRGLAFYYFKTGDPQKAIRYFQEAGDIN